MDLALIATFAISHGATEQCMLITNATIAKAKDIQNILTNKDFINRYVNKLRPERNA